MTTIDRAAIETLAANFAGELIQPDDPGYDAARQIWNGHIQRRPALIARCRGVADVIAAVRFGREHDLPASVRGGGHAVAGHAICDDGLVIDLSAMTGSTGRPTGAHHPARRRLPQRAPRPGEPGVRAGGHRRDRQPHRDRRPDPGRRDRSPHAQVRAGDRRRSAPAMSSPPTANSSSPASRRTPSCSGGCGAAAATSASSPTSRSRCSRSARPCSPAWWRGRWTRRPRCSGSSASSSPSRPTRSA